MARPTKPLGNGYPLSRDLTPQLVPVDECKPLGRQTRTHPPHQVRKLAASLHRFGFVLPILIDSERRVVAGWGLVQAARQLGLSEVPAVSLTDVPEAELRTLRLALNRITDDAEWDGAALKLEFSEILELDPDLDLTITGFEMGEIVLVFDDHGRDQEDDLAPAEAAVATPVTRAGDLWVLGEHRLLCGDARQAESYARLLASEPAQMVFTDPPYNVAVGHVCGRGAVKHAEFAIASGELTPAEFMTFLTTTLGHAARHSSDGAIHYICMDWRHQRELLAAADQVYSELKNLCVWRKAMPGWGRSTAASTSLYSCSRSAPARTSTTWRWGAMAGTAATCV